jgi:hypothetical protein
MALEILSHLIGRNRLSFFIFFSALLLAGFILPCAASAAWTGEYWNIPIGGPQPIPSGAADFARSDETIDFDWGMASPDPSININGFAARWTQTLDLSAGLYHVRVEADDGVRVYLDNVAIIDHWVDQSPTEYNTVLNIAAGEHEWRAEYYEDGGGAVMRFSLTDMSPVLQSASPTKGATGVGLDGNLVLTFASSVNAGAGSADDIVLYDGAYQVVESFNVSNAARVHVSGIVVTIDPTSALAELTDYHVRIQSDALYSVAEGGPYTEMDNFIFWNFRTGDFTAPTTSDDYGAKDGVWQNANQTITLSPADPSGSGLAWTRYCTDDGGAACSPAAGTTLSAPYQVAITGEGTTYLRYASRDSDNNTQATVTRVVRIDKTAPTVSAGSDKIGGALFSQTASASDAISGLNASSYHWTKVSGLGTVAFSAVDALTTSIDADQTGTYVLGFSATDHAGNTASDTFTFTKTGAIALPAKAFLPPQAPAGGFGIKINRGAATARERNVALSFSTGADTAKMAVSRTSDFRGASIEAFSPTKAWDLCAKDAACAEGSYSVFVKFYTVWGQASAPVTASIELVADRGKGENQNAALAEGALVKTKDSPDIYIVKYAGDKRFKRLILSPSVFEHYGHLKWENVRVVEPSILDSFATSSLVRVAGDDKVYMLYPAGDAGKKRWIQDGAALARLSLDPESIYEINAFDRDSYETGEILS